jgi:hypothetical protein
MLYSVYFQGRNVEMDVFLIHTISGIIYIKTFVLFRITSVIFVEVNFFILVKVPDDVGYQIGESVFVC